MDKKVPSCFLLNTAMETIYVTRLNQTPNMLQDLLRILLLNIFKNPKCIIYIISTQNNYYQNNEIASIFDTNSTLVVNPTECIPGCYHYILQDPEEHSSWISKCLLENKDYLFNAIIFLDSYNTKQITSYHGKAYALDAVFVFPKNDYYILAVFNNWEVTKLIEINYWYPKTNTFFIPILTRDVIHRNLEHKSKKAILPFTQDVPVYHKADRRKGYGVDYKILQAFIKSENFEIEDVKQFKREHKKCVIIGHRSDGQYHNNSIYSYPISAIETSFMVPIPKTYHDWSQLFKVFNWDLWLSFLFTYFIIGIYFKIYKHTCTQSMPSLESITYFVLQQSLNLKNTSTQFLARFGIALLLILGVLSGSIYSSGIVTKLVAPSYEKLLKTNKDLADSQIPLMLESAANFIVPPENKMTILERKIFTKERINSEGRYPFWDCAIVYNRSEYKMFSLITGMHTPLQESLYRIYSKYELVSNNTIHVHLISKLNTFMLWCKESGLPQRWEWELTQSVYNLITMKELVQYRMVFDVDPIVLTLGNLRVVFTLWLIGVMLSIFLFTLEHVVIHLYWCIYSL